MRHQKGSWKLNRSVAHRRAMFRNMATALLREERIETTLAKAKALQPYAERLITLGKRGDLHARRLAAGKLFVHRKSADAGTDHEVLRKLFGDLADRFRDRKGGYTRVLKKGFRRGDASPVAMIELVERGVTTSKAAADTDGAEERAEAFEKKA